jgi:tRNA U34 5-methylaminomethyl-2-thiouridine-forming methyltransferase MnmC
MERIIEKTADGSNTLYLPELDEHYHSIKGALTESMHIFIHLGLNHSKAIEPNILEIGFGTGLNAFLTLKAAKKEKRKINYTSIELYPLSLELIKELNYSSDTLFYKLHQCEWNKEQIIDPYFTLYKIEGDYTNYTFSNKYDIIYFDAFAPDKQPEMWNPQLFNTLYSIMNKNGILTTYCSKGVVRRMLQSAGFTVERLQGPVNGKREVLRATKNDE